MMEPSNERSLNLNVYSLIVFATVFTVDAYSVRAVLLEEASLFTLASIHMTVSALLAFWVAVLHHYSQDIGAPGLLAILHTALGPFGVASCLFLFFFSRIFHHQDVIHDWLKLIWPEEDVVKSELVYERIIANHEALDKTSEVVAFQDTLHLGTERQKRIALTKMANEYTPAFAYTLRRALNDSNNAIRVQAAAVITKIEGSYLDTIQQAEERVARNKSRENLETLAQAYDAYAFSGIVKEDQQQPLRKSAIDIYRNLPDQANQLALGRLLIRDGQLDEAEKVLRNYIEAEKKPNLNEVLWLLEVLYQQGKFDQVRTNATRFSDRLWEETERTDPFFDAARLWISPESMLGGAHVN